MTLEDALVLYANTKVDRGGPIAIRENLPDGSSRKTRYEKYSDPRPREAGRRNKWTP